MIKNFNVRYQKLLKEAEKDSIVSLPSASEHEAPFPDHNLKKAENGFIDNYCLDRQNSHKILKTLKIVLFATSLSLLNHINVEAQEITQQEVIEENTENSEDDIGLLIIGTVTICGTAIMIGLATLLPFSTTYTNSPKKEEKTGKIKVIKLKDLKNK